MAIIICGKSRCTLCDQVIEENDAVVMFPAFLRPGHRLWSYSDGGFHEHCFNNCPDREAVERVYRRWREIYETRPRKPKNDEEIETWHRSAFADFNKEEYPT